MILRIQKTSRGRCPVFARLSVLALGMMLWGAVKMKAQSNRKMAVPAQETKGAFAARVERAPRLDGSLADSLWQSALPIMDFKQREPYEGQEPAEKTEVRILYTRREVYFGIVCYDASPKGIVATELRRDLSQDLDDNFEILIDSSHDRRNAYVFQINPLGTQSDGIITEERRTERQEFDPGWDGVWISAPESQAPAGQLRSAFLSRPSISPGRGTWFGG